MARGKSADVGGTDIDRLSTLPDSVLCHILSFLPTITSVTTMSLVSRRWRHLWKDLQVFHFDQQEDLCNDEKFVLFVNAVLFLRRSRDIRKFHLWVEGDFCRCKNSVSNYVETWILAAVGPHLQDMSLMIYDLEVRLPSSFLMNCTNLVSLSLSGDIYIDDKHSSIYFPSLKTLYNHSSCATYSKVPFLTGCPRLETLDTYFENGNSMKEAFTQPASSSKSLNSSDDNFSWTCVNIGYRYVMTLGVISHFQSMAEAFLNFFTPEESEFVDPILKELRDYFDDVYLTSCHSTSKWPLHAPVLNCPEFRNLHHLKFILRCFDSNLLLNVLGKCRVLQVLIIKSNKEEPSPLRTWEPHSTKTPKCFKSHLTYIHIEGYQGFEDELTFAEYILRKGLVLETMLIFVDTSVDTTNKSRSIKRLTNITKGSVNCQLKFDPYGST